MIDKLKLVSLNDTLHEIVTSNATYKIGRAPDPVEFMEPDMNRKFLNDLNSSRPSDVVFCNLETSAKLIGLWKPGFQEDIEKSFDDIPSDIFFSGNIPLTDMLIDFKIALSASASENFTSRIFIYPDYDKRLMNAGEDEAVEIGIVSFSVTGTDKEMFVVLVAAKGNSKVLRSNNKGYRGFSAVDLDAKKSAITVSESGLDRRINIILNVWYGIQIALLNPLTKDVFAHGKPVPMNNNKSNNKQKDKKKKRVVRYIKRHVINPEELDMSFNVSTDSDKKYTRKTMAWYVIGHWRTNKNGTKTFIKGYWKGPLKAIKNAETRERELVTV